MIPLLFLLALNADDPAAAKVEPPAKAEPIPKYVRRYFERCDAAKESMKDGFKKELESLAVRIQSTPAKSKASLIRQRDQTENSLRELNATHVRAGMPLKAEIGEVGHLRNTKVAAVLDKHTMIVVVGAYGFRTNVAIIEGWDTTGYVSGKAIPQDEIFKVTSLFADPKKLKLGLGDTGLGTTWELERIPRGEVMKWREQFNKEKAEAQKKAKEAEAKPEAEPRPKPVKPLVEPPVKVSIRNETSCRDTNPRRGRIADASVPLPVHHYTPG